VEAPVALGREDGWKLLLLTAVADSENLRRSIEKDTKAPPTKSDGCKQDKEMLERATVNDVVRPEDFTANGIVHLANWPISTDGHGRAPGSSRHVQRKWDDDRNRHIVMDFRPTLEDAFANVKGRNLDFWKFHTAFDWAKERVGELLKSKGKSAEPDKLTARAVLYLIQMVATILW
jgi:hypothetical protein